MHSILLAALLAASEAAPAPRFSINEIAPGVFAAIADPADDASLGNAGFVIGSEAVLVVDSFATPQAAERLLAEIRSRTPRPIRFLVDTHFHGDHLGGNLVFAKAGAAVLAHENVRAWARREWEQDRTPAQKARAAAFKLPDLTYREGVSVWLGDRRVDVLHRPGHTGSDSIVSVPDARVLFGGDLVLRNAIPNLSAARTEAWIQTLDGLLKDRPDWTFVPGHGAPGKALDVRSFRDYLNGLRQAVIRARSEGKSGADLVAAVKPQLARFSQWTWFEYAEGNVADVEAELMGTKVYPPAPPP